MGTWQTYDGRVYDDDGTLVEDDAVDDGEPE